MSHTLMLNYVSLDTQKKYKVTSSNLELHPNNVEVDNSKILAILKKLNVEKDKIDELMNIDVQIDNRTNSYFQTAVFLINPYSCEYIKSKLIYAHKAIFPRQNVRVTNAYIKMLEAIRTFNIFDAPKSVFFNAEFPGDFIKASIFYCAKNGIDIDWVASSLEEDKENGESSTGLKDKYKLYERHPDRWMMGEHASTPNRGDLTEIDDIQAIISNVLEKYPDGVDVYTCDVGIFIKESYNEQEEKHLKLQLGQILCMLGTLSDGGFMMCKFYTFSSVFLLSLFRYLAGLFNNLYVFKPKSSRSTNSEIYLVGEGFIKKKANSLILTDYFVNFDTYIDARPNLLGSNFDISDLEEAFKGVFNRQIEGLRVIHTENLLAELDLPKYELSLKPINVEYIKFLNPITPAPGRYNKQYKGNKK